MKIMTLLELECILGRKFPYSDLVKEHSSVGGIAQVTQLSRQVQ